DSILIERAGARRRADGFASYEQPAPARTASRSAAHWTGSGRATIDTARRDREPVRRSRIRPASAVHPCRIGVVGRGDRIIEAGGDLISADTAGADQLESAARTLR